MGARALLPPIARSAIFSPLHQSHGRLFLRPLIAPVLPPISGADSW